VIGDACRTNATGPLADWEGAARRPVSQETSSDPHADIPSWKGVALVSRRSIISPALATVAGALTLGAVATAVAATAAPKVTIRIEGAKRTLLATTTVREPASGSITQDGAPSGKCPADSAAGVLNAATKGSWSGSWESKYNDYLVTKILGDTESGSKSYFEILVNNVPAITGPCEIKLKAGDQLLFGAVPLSGKGYPLVISAPKTATKGSSLKVKVDDVNGKGKSVPLVGATISGGGATATTNAKGIATLKPQHSGKLTLSASKTGFIRAATVTVGVAS
jgi:hypothetical protein